MRKFYCLLTLFLTLSSSQSDATVYLEGTVNSSFLNGEEIIFEQFGTNQVLISIDTVVIENKKFELSSKHLNPGVYHFYLNNQDENKFFSFFILLKENEIATLKLSDFRPYWRAQGVVIGGNQENESLQKFYEQEQKIINSVKETETVFKGDLAAGKVTEWMLELYLESLAFRESKYFNLVTSYVYDNISDNPLAEIIFLSFLNEFSWEQIDEVLLLAPDYLRYNPIIVNVFERKKQREKEIGFEDVINLEEEVVIF